MSDRPVKVPGPDHPITISQNPNTVEVRLGGHTIARSSRALTLHEGGYPPVHYIPRADTQMSHLQDSTRTSYCPYKGEANYFSISVKGDTVSDAVWYYDAPFDAVGDIKDHLAFYTDKVEISELSHGSE